MSLHRRAGCAVLVFALAHQGQGVWSKAAPMTGVRSELQAVMAGGKTEDKRQPNLL
jgi:hypothetical protein